MSDNKYKKFAKITFILDSAVQKLFGQVKKALIDLQGNTKWDIVNSQNNSILTLCKKIKINEHTNKQISEQFRCKH